VRNYKNPKIAPKHRAKKLPVLKSSELNENWFRTTLYSIGDGVITTDKRGCILQMNPVAEKLTGWNESDAKGKGISKVFHIINELTRKRAVNPVRRILREGIVIGLANHTVLISRDGKEYPIADAGSPIRDDNGKIVGAVLVFRDQSAERQAQQEIRKARDYAEAIVETVREPLLVLDPDIKILSANQSFYKIFKTKPAETVGQTLYQLGNRQWDIPELRFLLENILPMNTSFDNFEVTHKFEKIGTRTMLLNARRVHHDDEKTQMILLAIEDITERKKLEESRAINEERFKKITEVISNYAYAFRVEPDKTLRGEWLTESFAKTFGYSLEEIDNRGGWQSIVHPEDLAIAKQHAMKVAAGNKDVCEMRFVAKDGTVHWLRDYATPVWDEKEKRVVRIYGASQDITKQKAAEQAIREREEWFRKLADTTSTAIFIYQGDKFVYVNRATQELTGYSEKELLSMNFWDVVHPEHRELVRQRGLARQRGAKLPERYQIKIINKYGTERWIDLTAGKIDWQGKPAGIGTAFDITDIKQSETALRQSEQLLRTFLNSTSDFVFLKDNNFRHLLANNGLCNFYGKNEKEIIGKTDFDLMPEKDALECRRSDEQALNTKNIVITEEFVREQYFETLKFPIKLSDKEWGVGGFIRNITAQKEVEKEITLLAHAIKSISDCVSITDMEDKILYVNNAFLKTYGYQEDELIGKHISIVRSDKNSPEIVKQILAATKLGGWEGELINKRKDGSEFYVRLSTSVVRDTKGTPIALIGVATDVTEQKKAEEALRNSEASYRGIINSVSEAIYIHDKDGRFIDVNDGAIKMYGYDREFFLGKTPDVLSAPGKNDMAMVAKSIEKAFNGEPQHIEFWGKHKNGTIFPKEVHLYPGKYFGKNVLIAVAQDITQRKKAEEEIRISHQRYERFFLEDLTGDYISTPEGKIITCNPAFIRMFGFSNMEEALATNMATLFRSHEERARLLSRLQHEKKLEYIEIEMMKRDGTPIYIVANIIGRFDKDDHLIEIQGYLFDDTKRRQLEEGLRHAQKLESLGTLASGIAHDFNNVLGIILGHATLLERVHANPEKFAQSIDAITSATQRGASLVKQMLTFARKTEVVFQPLELNILVKEVAKMLRETFPKTIEVETSITKDLPPINGDPTQIHQILLNLCVNARDAMPKGGTLTITTEIIDAHQIATKFPNLNSQQYILLSVTDTGIGMDKATLNRIFEPFFTTKAPGFGTGLGLSVVHGIVSSHGGFIDVKSSLGKGTTFYVYLPAAQRTVLEYQSSKKDAEEAQGGTETILIIEDEELLRELLQHLLISKGYKVISAKDGLQGVEIYKENYKNISLVISDLGLPKLSGEDVFKQIKQFRPEAKVILASGFIEPELKSQLMESGVKDFIQKPYTPNEVLNKTRKVIDANS